MSFNSKIVRATRPRVCSKCRRTIQTGDRYERTVEIDEHGVTRIEKVCLFHDKEGNPTMGITEYAETLYGPPPEGDEDPHTSQAVPDPGDSPIYNDMTGL